MALLLWGCDESTIPTSDDDPSEFNTDLGDLEGLFQLPDLTGTTLLIRNISIVDNVNGIIIPEQDVLIRGDIIEEIASTGNLVADEIIDGSGKFLIPGLSDMHTHPVTTGRSARNDLFLFLAHGVTTIRVMWGFEGHLKLRDSINNRHMLGPNMVVASQGFVGNSPLWPGSVQTSTSEEVRVKVREFVDQGYDYLKVYSGLPVDQYQALIEEAIRLDIPAIGHIPGSINLGTALNANQFSIEHLNSVNNATLSYEEIAQIMISNQIWICPTLTVGNRTSTAISQYQEDPIYQALSPPFKTWLQDPLSQPVLTNIEAFMSSLKSKLRVLNEAGVPLIAGTDMGIRYVMPGVSLHEELQHYVDAGLSPLQALNTSTLAAQRMIDKNYPGTIEVGRIADLVILSKDPLADIDNLSEIQGVVKSGYYLNREEIEAIIAALTTLN